MKPLAVLYIFLQVVKPAILKGQDLDWQIFNLFASDYVTDAKLISCLSSLHEHYHFWLHDKESFIRWEWVRKDFRQVVIRLLTLVNEQEELDLPLSPVK